MPETRAISSKQKRKEKEKRVEDHSHSTPPKSNPKERKKAPLILGIVTVGEDPLAIKLTVSPRSIRLIIKQKEEDIRRSKSRTSQLQATATSLTSL